MYINPTNSINMPIVQPMFECFVSENALAWDVIVLMIQMILVATASLIIGLYLNRYMRKRNFFTNKTFTLISSTVMAFGLSLRYGMSIYTFQGLFLFFLLLYASMSDLTDRNVANHMISQGIVLCFTLYLL